jgi:uncharacterized protein DUF6916
MSQGLNAEHFLPHVNKVFRIRGAPEAFTLTLSRIERAPSEVPAELPQPFNLIFAGAPQPVLREGLYTVDVDGGPDFQLYIMPIHTAVRDRQDYQASFN